MLWLTTNKISEGKACPGKARTFRGAYWVSNPFEFHIAFLCRSFRSILQKSINLPVCHAFVVRRKTFLQVRERKSIVIQFWNNNNAKEPKREEISKQVVMNTLQRQQTDCFTRGPRGKFSILRHIPNVDGKFGSSR